MGTAIITEAGNVAVAAATSVGSVLTNIAALFWDKTDGLTVMGSLLALSAGIGIAFLAYRTIRGLAHVGK
jgi:hypothetical protein